VIGSGGREHALSWKLSQSSKVETIFTAPGNGGTQNNIPINVDDLDGLADFAQKNNCFTVVGPEDPLAAGIVDKFNKLNLKVFGPSQKAAQLESSKIWAKDFMKRNEIPSARFEIFDDAQKAQEYVESLDYNVVVKADGLAAGKGVIVCNSNDEAISAIQTILVKKTFGDAGNRIIIEERINGIEASYIALSDAHNSNPQDTIFRQIGYDKAALIMSVVAFLSITFSGLVMAAYGGGKFVPDMLIPVIGICFILFYGLVPIGTILGLAKLMQEGAKHRVALLALMLNAFSVLTVYVLYLLYD
jgi:hypothetical protein